MKKIVFIFLFGICIFQNQEAYSQASVLGNSGTTGDYCGWDNATTIPFEIRHNNTTNPQDIDFYTSNSQRMTILSSGLVGINTTAPTIKLEVWDGTTNTPQLRLANSTGNHADFHVTNASNLIIRPNSGSFVGIGNWTQGNPPQMKLDVYAPSNPQLRLTQEFVGSNAGRWANFRVDGNGDLVITPWKDDGTVARYTGIGNAAGGSPLSTIHIFGDARINTVSQNDALTRVLVLTAFWLTNP